MAGESSKRSITALCRECAQNEGEDEFSEGGDREHRLLRLLVGHRMRQRKRARRLLVARLLRERVEA
jgi:hypothetical protein